MPTRLKKLIKRARAFEIDCEKPSKGSHWKFKKNGKSYTVPAHNGPKTGISDIYINGLCRCYEIDRD